MFKLRTLPTFTLAVALALPLTGCFEDIAGPYDGPTVVEFAQVSGSSNPYSRSVSEDAGRVELTVNLIGPQQQSPLVINVDVTDASTADEGSDYSLPNGTQVTIPAGSSSGTFVIEVSDDGDDEENETLVLELTGSADGSIGSADNFDEFEVTIQDNDD